MVKIACLDASSEFFKLEARPVEVQSLWQEVKKRRKRKGENKIKKIKKAQNFAFYTCLSDVMKRDVIQLENLQKCPKMCFWQKAPGVNGLKYFCLDDEAFTVLKVT